MALPLFFGLSAAHILAQVIGIPAAEFVTKALLMPVLAWWLHQRGGPRLMVAGLLLSTGGDIALEFDGLFIAGMLFFAAAHVCYVTFFMRSRKAEGRLRWTILGAYAAMWAVGVAILWPGLGALQIPVAVYSLLLTATAATAASYGVRTGVGGALFLVSDLLIGLRLTDTEVPMHGVLVMATYIAAQYLLASGTLRRVERRAPTPS
ncbi:lysoplasmalogenase [Actinocorallia sp. B10E7]|uniref:lysoplasmalogenase n=1 Tax=Actinocorallia sp. B10E7 TaxID=3153558 RepID=UPI00325CE6E8